MMRIGWLLVALAALVTARALNPEDYTFQVSAQAAYSPPRLVLSWPAAAVSSIQIRKKLPEDSAWGPIVANLPGSATAWTDFNVEIGSIYEYQLAGPIAANPGDWAYGYLAGGIEVPIEDKRGRVILIADRTHAAALSAELALFEQDLIGDGWTVVRREVWPDDSPTSVKALIVNEYTADPSNTRAVFLFGRVPVPYSGDIYPDLHPTHRGAWPADVYYGDVNGVWTDQIVNFRAADFDENNNVPGDGKFDQSVIPSAVELEVGRVDFSRLPAFATSERELLRNYLRKNRLYRHGLMGAPLRGLIRDTFQVIDDDAPALDAWRAFPALFGRNSIREVGANQFFSTLANEAFLWAYAGGGGDFDHADGVGSTADFAANDPRAVFLLLHGSYFGDWNTENNFLRAGLATPNYSLVSIWSSLPHWFFQHMAVGKSVGYATRLTQNNRGLYRSHKEYAFGEPHITMMGDPTLRSFVARPPSNMRMNDGAKLELQWAEPGAASRGYHVYRANTMAGPFVRLNRSLILTNVYEHAAPAPGDYVYMVRSVELQATGSGSFYNMSQGAFLPYRQTTNVSLPRVEVAAIDSIGDENGNAIVFQFTRTGDVSLALNVSIQFSGTATLGTDFAAPSSVTFAAGQAETKLTINPIADGANEPEEILTLTIQPGSAYTIGVNAASGAIAQSGESRFSEWRLTQTGIELIATGFPNQSYRVESRSSNGAWQTRTNAFAPANGIVTFRESNPNGECVFFRIVWQ